MTGGGSAGTADDYFTPREAPLFRARLAARVAVPLDRGARSAAVKVAWSAALAAPPVTIALVAPAAALTLGAVLGLCCAALPGVAATAWSAARLRDTRQLAARALRQAGAEQRTAWLIAAGRLALFAGVGALVAALCLTALHDPLVAVLPKRSPLRAMFAGGAFDWIVAVAMTGALASGGALLASSPFWTRVDWSRFDLIRYGRPTIARAWGRVRVGVRRASRRPR
jgi:hypothetical protein